MDLNNKISFAVSKVDLLEEINNNELMKLRLWIVSEGVNRHGYLINFKAIQEAKSSLVGKPILVKYNKFQKDFEEHNLDESPVGVFLKSEEIYEMEDEDGIKWLAADAYVWKRYCKNVVEVFQRDEEKSISMEILVLETKQEDGNANEEITSFLFTAVTLLGKNFSPAIENSKAEVLQFSELVEQTEAIVNKVNFSNLLTETKFKLGDSVIPTEFHIPEHEGKVGIISEVRIGAYYAIKFSDTDEQHEWYAEDELKVANQQNESSEIMCHIERHRKSLGLDKKDFSENFKESEVKKVNFNKEEFVKTFNENANTMWDSFIEGKEISVEDIIMFAKEITNEDFLKLEKEKDDLGVKFSTLETEKATMSEKFSVLETEKLEVETKFSTLEIEKSEVEVKFSNLESIMSNVETDKLEFATKITNLETENTELKEFKSNIEEQDKKTKIDFAISSVSEDLNQEQIDEWRNKISEYDNIELFSNAIKAFAYSVSKTNKTVDDGIVTASIPFENKNNKKNKGLWD